MKSFSKFVGLLLLAEVSLAQYSYVYQIRHDNKEESRPIFRDLTEYKHGRPSEMPRSNAIPSESPKTRDFEVKTPIGPNLMNAINKQNTEKSNMESSAGWSPAPESRYEKSSLALQSDTNSPIYARQPSHRSYSGANELPLYGEKIVREIPQNYPILESPHMRERKREEQPLSYSLSVPSPQPQRPIYRPAPHPNDQEQKMRTVHSIQTPNYKIQLVSQPEPLEKLLPLLQQYQLSTKPFQPSEHAYSNNPQSSSYSHSPQPAPYSQMHHSPPSYAPMPPPQSAYPGKALMLSVEPDARITEEMRHNIRNEQRARSIPSVDRHVYEERPKMIREFRPEPMRVAPKPILDLPRQELPPQIRKLKSQGLPKQPPQEPQHFQLLQARPQYSREELVPVTALYQMAAPNLAKGNSYPGVEYSSDDEPKRDGRQSITTYKEEPVIYRIIDSEGSDKSRQLPFDINEQLENLGRENPSAQKIFFEKIKADAVEMPERGQTKYLKLDEQSMIPTDPNYKSSPLPEEYKPYTQTRYYKAYV